jgi:DNA primase
MAQQGDFAFTVKQQADIVRIVGDYVKLRKSGAQNFSGLCPFHHEKTPSFSVHASRQFFHCFGCGESGDVFSFIQKIESITFPEAVRFLAQKLGIPIPKATFNSEAEAREARVRGALLDMHERACAWFQQQLQRPEAAHAREYLAGRGMTPEMTAKFRVGYAPDSGFLLRDALKRDFNEELMRESGLFSWKESAPSSDGRQPTAEGPSPRTQGSAAIYSKFRNRVTFPICNESGRVIAFTGRTLATDEKSGPKYLNSPETAIYSKGHVLFNLDKAKEPMRKLDYVILVEGQMDCVSVYAAGLHNVIATSGTAFTEPQARLLARFTKNIVVNFDPDTAGANAAEKSLTMLVEQEFNIKVVTLEQGYDPDLFIRRQGLQAYGAALRSAPKYFEYLIERARIKFPHSAEGKVKAINFLLPHIQRVPSRIVRDELTNEIAQKLSIDSGVLRQELKNAAVARGAVQVKAPTMQLTLSERILIRALATRSDIPSDAEGVFDPCQEARAGFANERLHEGLNGESLVEALLANQNADPMTLPVSDAERSVLAEILMNEHEELTPELVGNAIQALRQKKTLDRREQALKQQIADAERRQDPGMLAQLMQEKLKLDRELASAQ